MSVSKSTDPKNSLIGVSLKMQICQLRSVFAPLWGYFTTPNG